jgi:2-polyprenyl-3-methyl-5-hydroxy-6-metoxy-1,4-benzoquinol methylase
VGFFDATSACRYLHAIMDELPAPTFPRIMRRLWRRTEPASVTERRCDALDRATAHCRLATRAGDYWVCSETGQMSNGRINEVDAQHYDRWWASHAIPQDQAETEIARLERWLARFDSHRQGGRLLEIGSGQGMLLQAAMRRGWEVEGNEISPLAAEGVQRISGAEIHVGPIESIDLPCRRYDLIICDNVFEHLARPLEVLRKLRRALRPSGVLFLQTVCAQSLSVWAQPRGWCYYCDGHTVLPTLVSLRHYCQASGLKVRRLETHGFRGNAGGHRDKVSGIQKRVNKLGAAAASMLSLGHRMRVLLEPNQESAAASFD